MPRLAVVVAAMAFEDGGRQAGDSSVGRASDCRSLQLSNGPWFDSGSPDFGPRHVPQHLQSAHVFAQGHTTLCTKSPLWRSSPRPYAYEAHALPTELRRPAGLLGFASSSEVDLRCLHKAVLHGEQQQRRCRRAGRSRQRAPLAQWLERWSYEP